MFLDRLFLSSLVLAVPLGDALHEKDESAILDPPVGAGGRFQHCVHAYRSKCIERGTTADNS